MALDELHARRLATVIAVFEGALDRLDLLLEILKTESGDEPSDFKPEQICRVRERMASVRERLDESAKRFSVRVRKPGPRQVVAAELSRLWVVLENARPERMKGYGREFSPEDKADWDKMIEGLMFDIKEIRRTLIKKDSKM
ncbi:MAG: hypothetical protein ABSF46_14955 [Terriglobia bacterium]|jgi:hypothetical protein